MAYDTILANRVREQLAAVPGLSIEEKKMFGGLAFLVNDKMCINITEEGLMCRYDPVLEYEVVERNGYQPMIMRGRQLKGYCYVTPEGFASTTDFNYWIKLCLDYNEVAKAARRKK